MATDALDERGLLLELLPEGCKFALQPGAIKRSALCLGEPLLRAGLLRLQIVDAALQLCGPHLSRVARSLSLSAGLFRLHDRLLRLLRCLLAAPRVVSCTEAARVQPEGPHRAAHDALTRLLQRLDPDPLPLWLEAEQLVDRDGGLLILDDTTLDKAYARQIALVHRHWSGKHRRIVAGINLVTLVWSEGTHAVPCDYRLFDAPNDGLTKNAHFRAMLETAKSRSFVPRYVCFDSWYSSLANLKQIRTLG